MIQIYSSNPALRWSLFFLSFSLIFLITKQIRNFNLISEPELSILMASSSSNQNTNSYVSSFTFTSPIKLDRSNYRISKSQVLSSVRANGLEDLLDRSKLCPNQFLFTEIEDSTAEAQINPAFTSWKRNDQLLLIWLMSSISIEILSLVVNSQTLLELWTNLEQQFGSETFAKKIHLKMMLNILKKRLLVCDWIWSEQGTYEMLWMYLLGRIYYTS